MSEPWFAELLGRLRKHHEAMTPPPWHPLVCETVGAPKGDHSTLHAVGPDGGSQQAHADAYGIAALRNALPDLLRIAEACAALLDCCEFALVHIQPEVADETDEGRAGPARKLEHQLLLALAKTLP